MRLHTLFTKALFTLAVLGFSLNALAQIDYNKELKFSRDQLLTICKNYKDTSLLPRTTKDGKLKGVPTDDWTGGFFPGSLWYLYEHFKDQSLLNYAKYWTEPMRKEQYNTRTHDLGFMIFDSFGHGYRLIGDKSYKDAIIQASKSLITRFDPEVGCIKSWDNKGHFLVIIDNMMNLEMLFETTKLTGDSTYYKIAVTHANTTIENHFRADNSSYHVVDYDTVTGKPVLKRTQQGLANESAWSRGQAWGLYGYTMCYRYTKDKKYLEQARKIADYWIGHKNLPKDLIPYWDFDAPASTETPRDAAAATITASGLLELSQYAGKEGLKYKNFGLQTLASLASPAYKAELGSNGGFIIKHCVGSKPHNSEVDVPLVYADYYFIEGLLRAKKLK